MLVCQEQVLLVVFSLLFEPPHTSSSYLIRSDRTRSMTATATDIPHAAQNKHQAPIKPESVNYTSMGACQAPPRSHDAEHARGGAGRHARGAEKMRPRAW